LAFYEATRDIGTEIVTLDVEKEFIEIAKTAFARYQATDRIQIIEGDCVQTLVISSIFFELFALTLTFFPFDTDCRNCTAILISFTSMLISSNTRHMYD
jgi:hypothetical protein